MNFYATFTILYGLVNKSLSIIIKLDVMHSIRLSLKIVWNSKVLQDRHFIKICLLKCRLNLNLYRLFNPLVYIRLIQQIFILVIYHYDSKTDS